MADEMKAEIYRTQRNTTKNRSIQSKDKEASMMQI